MKFLKLSRLAAFLWLSSIPLVLLAEPTAVDDVYSVNEDAVLTVAVSSLIDTDFDGGSGTGAVVAFSSADWDYLDQIQNQNGARRQPGRHSLTLILTRLQKQISSLWKCSLYSVLSVTTCFS